MRYYIAIIFFLIVVSCNTNTETEYSENVLTNSNIKILDLPIEKQNSDKFENMFLFDNYVLLETNDSSMIDLAVATNSEFVKVGISRGERVAKYNRLMEIEDELK